MKIKVRMAEEKDRLVVLDNELELARAKGNFLQYSPAQDRFLEATERIFDNFLVPWKPSYNILVAEIDGQVVGHVFYSVSSESKRAIINNLYVKPTFRRKGVSREILACIRSESKFKGLEYLTLHTFSDELRKIYERLGFKQSDKYGKNGFVLALN